MQTYITQVHLHSSTDTYEYKYMWVVNYICALRNKIWGPVPYCCSLSSIYTSMIISVIRSWVPLATSIYVPDVHYLYSHLHRNVDYSYSVSNTFFLIFATLFVACKKECQWTGTKHGFSLDPEFVAHMDTNDSANKFTSVLYLCPKYI
jgi:hypothetical protein